MAKRVGKESLDDSPMINPLAEKAPSLSDLGCSSLFMFIAEKDVLIPREIMIRFVELFFLHNWLPASVMFFCSSTHIPLAIKLN